MMECADESTKLWRHPNKDSLSVPNGNQWTSVPLRTFHKSKQCSHIARRMTIIVNYDRNKKMAISAIIDNFLKKSAISQPNFVYFQFSVAQFK